MTTAPVTSLTNLFSSVTTGSASPRVSAGKDFSHAMNHASGAGKRTQSEVKGNGKEPDRNTTISRQNEKNPAKVSVKTEKKVSEAEMNTAAEKAKELIQKVADKFDVSVEDVEKAMEEVGAAALNLLEPAVLTQVVLKVSGEDAMSILTDESFFRNLQDILGEAGQLMEDVAQVLEMNAEEAKNFLSMWKEEALNTEQEPVVTISEAEAQEPLMTEQPLEEDNSHDGKAVIVDREDTESAESPEENQSVFQKASEKTAADSNVTNTQDKDVNQKEFSVLTEVNDEKPSDTDEKKDTKGEFAGNGNQQHGGDFLAGLAKEAANLTQQGTETIKDTAFTSMFDTEDAQSVMKQMVDSMKLHLRSDITEMEVQLHPASLGSIHLQVASKNGMITAQFTAQHEEVKEALEAQIVQLKENLEERGIKVEAVEVAVASHEFERNLEQGERDAKNSEKAEAVKKTTRRRIFLGEENTEEDLEQTSEEDEIQVAMMRLNGNTMDIMA